ncbi:MAG: efflux RND transporter periplasmic adaptor subunit [Sediminibacterium sp.]|nr:efflux RND transporter periplasmic adaptor subunit [Sediminibacterium sp.]
MKSNQIFAIAGISLILACTANKKEEQKAVASSMKPDSAILNVVRLTAEQLKTANLSIGQVQNKEMHQVLKVNGLIDVPPSNIVSISIPLGGYLKKTNLIPGMFVKKGALLAVIEDPIYIQLQQDYLTAKSRLAYLDADFVRQRDLNVTKSTSDKIYQLAKSDFESQKYLVKSLQEKLKLIGIDPTQLNETTISRSINFNAPISGYVTKVNVNIGKYVTPTDVLFEIVDPSDLHVRLIVYENDVSNLKIGNEVVFTTNNDISKKYVAHVAVITPNINEERTTDVHCHLVNENVRLYPGTYVNAEIALNNAKVDALPEESIVKWENKPFVFVKQPDQTYKLVAVELGVSTNGFIEIKTNLKGQDIVLNNAYTLLMKLKNSVEE